MSSCVLHSLRVPLVAPKPRLGSELIQNLPCQTPCVYVGSSMTHSPVVLRVLYLCVLHQSLDPRGDPAQLQKTRVAHASDQSILTRHLRCPSTSGMKTSSFQEHHNPVKTPSNPFGTTAFDTRDGRVVCVCCPSTRGSLSNLAAWVMTPWWRKGLACNAHREPYGFPLARYHLHYHFLFFWYILRVV